MSASSSDDAPSLGARHAGSRSRNSSSSSRSSSGGHSRASSTLGDDDEDETEDSFANASFADHLSDNSRHADRCQLGQTLLDQHRNSTTQVNLVSSTTNSLMQDLHNAPTLTSVELAAAHPQQESEKKCIYAHPLFPLLASVLERCEASTAQLDTQMSGKESLEADVQAFLQQHQQQQQQRDAATAGASLDSGSNQELDQLMIEAVQVLGIHIIELEKVNELCRDFCSRYINTVRCRYQQADFLQHDSMPNSPSSESGDASPSTASRPPHAQQATPSAAAAAAAAVHSGVGSGGGHQNGFYGAGHPSQLYAEQAHHQQHHLLHGGGQAYPHYGYPGAAQPGLMPSGGGGGNIPLPLHQHHQQPPGGPQHHHQHHHHSQLGSPTDSLDDKNKQKRGVLPKRATQIMKQWLFQHLVHPYPTEDEKRQLAGQTNLTLLQVNNWFINARRRILQPMLDASSPESSQKKKKAQQNRPSNVRFWPANLASSQAAVAAAAAAGSAPSGKSSASHQQQQQQQSGSGGLVKEEAVSGHQQQQQQQQHESKPLLGLYPHHQQQMSAPFHHQHQQQQAGYAAAVSVHHRQQSLLNPMASAPPVMDSDDEAGSYEDAGDDSDGPDEDDDDAAAAAVASTVGVSASGGGGGGFGHAAQHQPQQHLHHHHHHQQHQQYLAQHNPSSGFPGISSAMPPDLALDWKVAKVGFE